MKNRLLYIFIFQIVTFLGYAQNDTINQRIETPQSAAVVDPGEEDPTGYQWNRDADGDGYGNPDVYIFKTTKPAGYVANQSDLDDGDKYITDIPPHTVYRDVDVDGFGIPGVYAEASVSRPGYVDNYTDCNDNDATVNPNTIWYRDADADGFGSTTVTTKSCLQPAGYIKNNTDCNDADAALNPNTTWYRDADGDGYGATTPTLKQCTQPAGYVRNSSDYNDTTINITNITPSTFYRDADNDTFGSPTVTVYYSVKPTGYVTNNADCNDADATINPNTKWYADNDLDTLGDPANFVTQCTAPAGNYVRDSSDNCPTIQGMNSNCLSIPNPSVDRNYILTKTYKQPVTAVVPLPTLDQAVQNITYFDGLGRPVQTNANKQSNTGKDIITVIDYDDYGRQTKEYLPYKSESVNMSFDSGALGNLSSYYASPTVARNGNPNQEATNFPFSEKSLENSPLNRVLKQAASGNDWRQGLGHEIKMDYQTNAGDVKNFNAVTTWSTVLGLYDISLGNAAGTVFYDAGQLSKTVTYDENTAASPAELNGSTVEFKNKLGQVILKRTYGKVGTGTVNEKHDTYYVYDQYGNLTYVIPPKADGALTATILNDLCYQYKYDYRNRLVEKKLPGKQWEFIIYDKLDRVAATGPASSPFSDLTSTGWLVTKYDAFNRPIITAWWPAAAVTNVERKTLQDAQNAVTTNPSETKIATATNTVVPPTTGVSFRYTNLYWPTSGYHVLTVNYYDDYNYPGAPTVPSTVAGTDQNVYYNSSIKPIGLSTGNWVRVLEASTANRNELTYTLYDAKARPVRTYTTNYLGGYTYTDSKLDSFSGKLEYNITKHKRQTTDTELTTKDAFTYTAQDRLLTQTHQINGGTIELIASNVYDELGNLISKKVGNTAAAPTQNINYTYNIRGWLTGINDVTALSKAGDPKDLFAFKLNYNTTTTAGVSALYNGNISETYWTSINSETAIRGYGYVYDNLNRLRTGISKQNGTVNNYYDETLTYDKNGNIMSLVRNGNAAAIQQIDNLAYYYGSTNNLNQLTKVIDNAAAYKAGGFVDSAANTVDDYSYDANGNMTKDNNKNITTIGYNHLNLPIKITFATTGNIAYLYNAAGQKLQKIVSETSKPVVTTDYLGGYQYDNAVLKFFPTAEGYVEPVSGSYKYVYQYKDHLGNIRLSYDKTLAIKEESNFYPFGLKQEGYNNVKTGVENKYKYNGKELQDELGLNFYDYGARNYDPALGRWMNIDPLAEKYFNLSPYNYVADNPIIYIDPDGKEIIVANKADQGTVLKMINSKALGTFAFNKSGHLYLAKAGGDSSKFSSYYSKQLVAAINDKEKINISIGQTFQEKGKTKSVDNDAGGGVTSKKSTTTTYSDGTKTVTKEADVTISGNPLVGLKDTNGNALTDNPADILAHELVGHAIPYITKTDTGNAVDNENKVRKDTNSPERANEPNHKE
ncbi:RHS repeat-associated core domain-containing protein [Flavobacterium sp. CF108]|uniref:DUF6443 domain-containing protein n=1 Tax=unclassified Flavobacterium TaxID=196869 RepID=UPI0008D4B769|nr:MULTISPECIES: DUF6443 domain-containing protein [unclassified Flavobacterium]SEP23491.1 RHS repeat-associated core domain-containing protein [Flavobacterium sp. fv08]SHI00854.1 RHS repeat-associated core domain-containing protein [Flavobacterium sp. CF108]